MADGRHPFGVRRTPLAPHHVHDGDPGSGSISSQLSARAPSLMHIAAPEQWSNEVPDRRPVDESDYEGHSVGKHECRQHPANALASRLKALPITLVQLANPGRLGPLRLNEGNDQGRSSSSPAQLDHAGSWRSTRNPRTERIPDATAAGLRLGHVREHEMAAGPRHPPELVQDRGMSSGGSRSSM